MAYGRWALASQAESVGCSGRLERSLDEYCRRKVWSEDDERSGNGRDGRVCSLGARQPERVCLCGQARTHELSFDETGGGRHWSGNHARNTSGAGAGS